MSACACMHQGCSAAGFCIAQNPERPIPQAPLPRYWPSMFDRCRTDPELLAHLKRAAEREMTPEERFEQRVSFASSVSSLSKDEIRLILRSMGY